MDCESLDNIIYPSGLEISNSSIPDNTTKVEYTASDDGITINNITFGIDKNKVEIPNSISEKNVIGVKKKFWSNVTVSEHTHMGGTATCTQKAECAICGAEHGELIPHKPSKTELKNPTCTEEGNSEYWQCSECEKYFNDENCTNEIALAETVIPATMTSLFG